MTSLNSVKIPATDKLRILRRLDQYRRWESLDDKRQCIQCGEVISGWDIEVVGGTRGLGPLRLQCPTENCAAIPMDWIIPNHPLPVKRERPAAMPLREEARVFVRLLRNLRLRRRAH